VLIVVTDARITLPIMSLLLPRTTMTSGEKSIRPRDGKGGALILLVLLLLLLLPVRRRHYANS
jgi:hypothetical protein